MRIVFLSQLLYNSPGKEEGQEGEVAGGRGGSVQERGGNRREGVGGGRVQKVGRCRRGRCRRRWV
jgi:hypothetical protein